MKASIVIGSLFGDEGKGITVDYLCSQARKPYVIRFSGGQQCGHTVMLNGKKHVHSNFGSGTLRGVPSYFSEHCTFYPATFNREKRILEEKGVKPVFSVHPLAKVTTPFDVAFNKLDEINKGHGTCGLGVGATMKRHLDTGYKLYAIDLTHEKIFYQKVNAISEYYKQLIGDSKEFGKLLEIASKDFDDFFNRRHITVKDYHDLPLDADYIFEGSQGIMLDMDHGIFPNVTYSNTTSKNAIDICNKMGLNAELFYVTRCYQTRHGNGWMSNQSRIKLINNEEEINTPNPWQGEMRIGEFDYDLLNYSISIDKLYHKGPYDMNLVVTCIDQRPNFKFRGLNHEFRTVYYSHSPESKDFSYDY